MSTTSSFLYYGAPLIQQGRDDDWVIDAISKPPEILLNFRKVAIKVAITNLRNHDICPRLDEMGFEKLVAPTQVCHRSLLDGSASSLEEYQHEAEVLLQNLTNANAVVFFDATFRCEEAGARRSPFFQPAHLRVHVDQNPRSARARALNHGGPTRQFRRFQIVNIWRPLSRTRS